jgi:hypothetical protein
MEIITGALDWTSIDSDNFAKFLDTETGRRLVPKLAALVPALLDKGDVNAILIRSGEVRGYQDVIQQLLFLAHPPPPAQTAQSTEYPDLLDNTKWSGAKLADPSDPNANIL